MTLQTLVAELTKMKQVLTMQIRISLIIGGSLAGVSLFYEFLGIIC